MQDSGCLYVLKQDWLMIDGYILGNYPLLNEQYNRLELWVDERLDQLIDAFSW